MFAPIKKNFITNVNKILDNLQMGAYNILKTHKWEIHKRVYRKNTKGVAVMSIGGKILKMDAIFDSSRYINLIQKRINKIFRKAFSIGRGISSERELLELYRDALLKISEAILRQADDISYRIGWLDAKTDWEALERGEGPIFRLPKSETSKA